ncbi:MAG: hypothetical protein U9Q74_09630 [Gemmatimonadota bacterium]|nr:hypothetical protein [Gemmatimonadota bacterium]
MAVLVAIGVHVGLLAWLGERRAAGRGGRPPAVEGLGAGAAGGLPSTSTRNEHRFRVVHWESGLPLAGVRVTDVFGNQVAWTASYGVAALQSRPAARLIVQFEKPGFRMVAREFGNTEPLQSHTIVMEPAPVPYAVVDTIFIQRCNYCHGAVGRTRDVDLTTYARVMASGAPGAPIVRAGKPDSSRIVRILSDSLGPDGSPSLHWRRAARLDAFELETIVAWIRAGAHGPGR